MASGPPLDGGGTDGCRENRRWVESKVYTRKSHNKTLIPTTPSSQTLATIPDAANSPPPHQQKPSDRIITIDLAAKEKHEIRDLRNRFISELELIRSLVRRVEARQMQMQLSSKDAGKTPSLPVKRTPVHRQLTVSVPAASVRDNGVVDVVEKEKRTPKVNQYYKNADFLLGTEKLPPPESNKKSRVHGIKNGVQSMENRMNEQGFKRCGALLSKLMKHNHGWVFNTPVDAEALGLPDYHKIITRPMDLGTVKSRLSKNWYKAPKEFAEDVRLTFHNGMTYNPKGQDVYIMAQQLLQIFEEQWSIIEADLAYLQSPLSMKKTPSFDMRRNLERFDSTISPLAVDSKTKSLSQLTNIGRPQALKKPKAKDVNKREMTFEEKQKLSNNLQNLPSEKLDMVVQIIKKRNLSLSQHEDEIEVDIDSVDTETLWELDRFVTNYKKSLSKIKRKAELAMLSKAGPQLHAQNREQRMVPNSSPPELGRENRTVIVEKIITSSPVGGTVGKNASRLSSSSSSSSDSGSSSSSDSDSESSSRRSSDGVQ